MLCLFSTLSCRVGTLQISIIIIKHGHVQFLVQALHWLPVQARIDYKLSPTCHNFSDSSHLQAASFFRHMDTLYPTSFPCWSISNNAQNCWDSVHGTSNETNLKKEEKIQAIRSTLPRPNNVPGFLPPLTPPPPPTKKKNRSHFLFFKIKCMFTTFCSWFIPLKAPPLCSN